jgi:hypothetical protein
LLGRALAQADTLVRVTNSSDQNANDSVNWARLGPDGTEIGVGFNIKSLLGFAVVGSFAGLSGASLTAAECPASPCSWGGGTKGSTPFNAGDLVIWTANAGSGGNGPLTFHLPREISGAGALIQEDAPGRYTAQISAFNGKTMLGSFRKTSDRRGDPIYIGVIDNSGPNISKVIFSVISTTNPVGDVTDFAIDTLLLRGPGLPKLRLNPPQGEFGGVKVRHAKDMNFQLKNRAQRPGPSITISSVQIAGSSEFVIVNSKTTCIGRTVLAPKDQCHVDVEFSPAGIGVRTPAILKIDDNAAYAPQTIPLSGHGK